MVIYIDKRFSIAVQYIRLVNENFVKVIFLIKGKVNDRFKNPFFAKSKVATSVGVVLLGLISTQAVAQGYAVSAPTSPTPATAPDIDAIAIGNGADATTTESPQAYNANPGTGTGNIAIGKNAKASGLRSSIAIGSDAKSNNENGVAIGITAVAGRDAIAIGLNNNAIN